MVTQSAHFHNGISATHLTLYNNEIMTAYDLTKIISNGSNGNPFFFSIFIFIFIFFMVSTTLSVPSYRCLKTRASLFVAGHTLPISLGSEQQGIHFRYWVIKFYECNLQRFVASSCRSPGLGPDTGTGHIEGVVALRVSLRNCYWQPERLGGVVNTNLILIQYLALCMRT